ncbi:MAG: AgmX/PglI C-terminal domain-containing protein [Myxococcota bacterium]
MPSTLELTTWWADTLIDLRHLHHSQALPWSDLRVEWGADHVVVNAPPCARIRCNNQPRSTHEPVVLRPDETLHLEVDGLTHRLRFVDDVPQVVSSTPTLDVLFAQVLTATLATSAMLGFALHLTPHLPALDDTALQTARRITSTIREPPIRKPPTPRHVRQGQQASGKQGTLGRRDAPRNPARLSTGSRRADREAVQRSPLLMALRQNGAVAAVLGSPGIGNELHTAAGVLGRGALADARGSEGLGTRSIGSGGGGNVQNIGVIGSPDGVRNGTDVSLSDTRAKRRVEVDNRRSVVDGGLSKDEVGQVIRRYLSLVKHCYEKELNRNPNLAGKVHIGFTIAGTGRVSQAEVQESALDDDVVETCVLRVVQRMMFPPPRGGGVVVVSYPFIFQSSGH